jgi:hypothetical protein
MTRRRRAYMRKRMNKLWRRVRKDPVAFENALTYVVLEGRRYHYARKQCV